jgi:hypothetical protein
MSLVGIDTSLSLVSLVRGTKLTVLADATAWLGRVPDFVVRPTGRGGGAAVPLAVGEIASVAGIVARLGGYYNDSPLSLASPVQGTYAIGASDARRARYQLRALGFPDSCPVLIDLEHEEVVTAEYVAGVRSVEPSGCLYGTLATCTLARAGGLRSWISSWGAALDYRNAAGKSLQGGNSMWQLAGNAFNGIADEDVGGAIVSRFWDGRGAGSPPALQQDGGAAQASVTITLAGAVALTVNGKPVQP